MAVRLHSDCITQGDHNAVGVVAGVSGDVLTLFYVDRLYTVFYFFFLFFSSGRRVFLTKSSLRTTIRVMVLTRKYTSLE